MLAEGYYYELHATGEDLLAEQLEKFDLEGIACVVAAARHKHEMQGFAASLRITELQPETNS